MALDSSLLEVNPPTRVVLLSNWSPPPVRVDQVRRGELATVARHQKRAGRRRAAVTSFCCLPEVERLLSGRGVPVIALLAEAHLETLHRLAQLLSKTRVGVVSTAVEIAHNLEHSIANDGLGTGAPWIHLTMARGRDQGDDEARDDHEPAYLRPAVGVWQGVNSPSVEHVVSAPTPLTR